MTRQYVMFAGLTYARDSPHWQSAQDAFATLAECGARKDEVKRFTFADLTYKIGGVQYKTTTREQRRQMRKGDGVFLAHGVSKNDPFAAFFAATPTFLPWRPSGRCACRRLLALEDRADVPPALRAKTPLFGTEVGAGFTDVQLDAAFRLLLVRGAGVSVEDALGYSVHSFRIYLACALLAAGCPRWLIMRMLRWRGEESLDIYARVSDHQWEEQLAGALGAQVDASLVPRLPRMDLSPEQESAFLQMAHALVGTDLVGARSTSA